MKSHTHTPAPDGLVPGGRLKSCSHCRTIGYQDDLFCPRCGRPFPAVCPECGTMATHPVAFYCVRCGEKLGRDRIIINQKGSS